MLEDPAELVVASGTLAGAGGHTTAGFGAFGGITRARRHNEQRSIHGLFKWSSAFGSSRGNGAVMSTEEITPF